MERRNQERRQITRGYGPDRRVQNLPIAGIDRRQEQRRIKDRRQADRREADLPPLYSLNDPSSKIL